MAEMDYIANLPNSGGGGGGGIPLLSYTHVHLWVRGNMST